MNALLSRWVEQSIDDPVHGTCLPACFASITGLDVPSFAGEEHWWDPYQAWLGEHGWQIITKPAGWFPLRPAIAAVASPSYPDIHHAVIVLGREVLWDPSPRRNDPGRAYGDPRYHIEVVEL